MPIEVAEFTSVESLRKSIGIDVRLVATNFVVSGGTRPEGDQVVR